MNWINKISTFIARNKEQHPVATEIVYIAVTLVAYAITILLLVIAKAPNPNMILVPGIVMFTALFGLISGAVSTLTIIGFSVFYFFFRLPDDESTIKLIIVIIGALLTYVIVALLKHSQTKYTKKLERINAFLEIDNQKLQKISTADSLTKTKNRFALRNDFDKFNGQNVHVMMYDIDNFKTINDTLGHTAGDYVLKNVGGITKEIFGEANCYRYGGDEFLIIISGMSTDDFKAKVKDLKQAINEVYLGESHIPTHFSGGFVYGYVDETSDLRQMIRKADELLYDAKKAGKDDTKYAEFTKNN